MALTHDLKMIYRKVEFADEGLGGGTNFGEYKPGPIDFAADHFDELSSVGHQGFDHGDGR